MRKDAAMPQPVLLALTITIQIPVVPTSAAIVALIALLTTYLLSRRDRKRPATVSGSELEYKVKVRNGADLSRTYSAITRETRFRTSVRSPVLKWIRIVTLAIAALVALASYIIGYVLNYGTFQIVCIISAGVLAILLVINLFAWLASLIDFTLSINLKPTTVEARRVLSLAASESNDPAEISALREAFQKDQGDSDLGNRLLDLTLSILAGISCGVITLLVFNSVLM